MSTLSAPPLQDAGTDAPWSGPLPPPRRPGGPLLLVCQSSDAPLSRRRLELASGQAAQAAHSTQATDPAPLCLSLPATAGPAEAAALLDEARRLDALTVTLETGALRRALMLAAWERGQVLGLWPAAAHEPPLEQALRAWRRGGVRGVALGLANGEPFLQQAVHEPAAPGTAPWTPGSARTPWLSLDDGPPLRAPTGWLRLRLRQGSSPLLQLLSSCGGRDLQLAAPSAPAPEIACARRVEVLTPWPWRHGSQVWRLDGQALTLRSPVQFTACARPLWLLAPRPE